MGVLQPTPDEAKALLHQVILPVFAAPLDGRLIHLGSCFVVCNGIAPGQFAEILDVFINDPSDLAVLTASFPDHVPPETIFRYKLAIDSSPPSPDTPVILAGYGDTDLNAWVDEDRGVSTATFTSRLDYRHGKIVGVFPSGDPHLRLGPSFQVDVPISSGMSGGPVINKTFGDEVVACGLNTSDESVSVRTGTSGSGLRAIAQMLWPCMGVPVRNVHLDGHVRTVRLLELARRGFIDDRGNPWDHIRGVPPPDVEVFTMVWE